MDITYIVLAVLGALELWTVLYLYRGFKSLESLIYPILANLVWIRENNNAIVESLVDMLGSRGVISPSEVASLKSLARPRFLTQEDLDKAEELLDKKPEELTDADLRELRRIALALLTWPSRGAARLALRLLLYASQLERGREAVRLADRVEISYVAETCTIKLQLRKGDVVETVEEADSDCVAEKVDSLKKLARREISTSDALAVYKICKTREDAGCKAIMSQLSPLEKKSLDLLIDE
ncbi:MAG: hypothetical protein ABWJ97_05480 [Thermoproteus sp.]